MVKTALAVCGEVMAPSLGTAGEFVIISGNAVERCLRTGKLLHFLQEQQIDVVICNGIGNCTAAMLAALGIAVIPGVSGPVSGIIARQQDNTLTAGKGCSCSDYGCTCGDCKGNF